MHRTDHEIICDWLRELSMEEYAPLFSEAGYDMPTISRMTPEDLTAIGIKKPRHRERIKQHIDSLQLPDNLPHYVPVSIIIEVIKSNDKNVIKNEMKKQN